MPDDELTNTDEQADELDLSFPTFEPTHAVPKRRQLDEHLKDLEALADDAMKNGAVEVELRILRDLVRYTVQDKSNKRGMLSAYYDRLVHLRRRMKKMQDRAEFQEKRIMFIRYQRHCTKVIVDLLRFADPLPTKFEQRRKAALEAQAAKLNKSEQKHAEARAVEKGLVAGERDWEAMDADELEKLIPEEQR